jgi:hypothetical protein
VKTGTPEINPLQWSSQLSCNFLSVSVKAKTVLNTFSPLRVIFLLRLAIIRLATCKSLFMS